MIMQTTATFLATSLWYSESSTNDHWITAAPDLNDGGIVGFLDYCWSISTYILISLASACLAQDLTANGEYFCYHIQDYTGNGWIRVLKNFRHV